MCLVYANFTTDFIWFLLFFSWSEPFSGIEPLLPTTKHFSVACRVSLWIVWAAPWESLSCFVRGCVGTSQGYAAFPCGQVTRSGVDGSPHTCSQLDQSTHLQSLPRAVHLSAGSRLTRPVKALVCGAHGRRESPSRTAPYCTRACYFEKELDLPLKK